SGGGQKCAGGTKTSGLIVAEAGKKQAAVGARLLVDLQPLMLESELHGVFAVNPLKVFLQNVVVFHVLEGACVGAAPLYGRVRTGEARFGEGGVRFSRGQSLESRLDGPLAVNG